MMNRQLRNLNSLINVFDSRDRFNHVFNLLDEQFALIKQKLLEYGDGNVHVISHTLRDYQNIKYFDGQRVINLGEFVKNTNNSYELRINRELPREESIIMNEVLAFAKNVKERNCNFSNLTKLPNKWDYDCFNSLRL